MDESSEKKNPKNPMLLSPVIRRVLEFLNIEDIKNCRLVRHEWGSTGKLALGSRARIHIHTNSPDRRPVDFQSCFLNSATLFSAFLISSYSTQKHENDSKTIEELDTFFEDKQKSIKELTLKFTSSDSGVKVTNIDLTSWIPKSAMVQECTKHMTKLSIEGDDKNLIILPFHLIVEIKELTLLRCGINLEAGIKICPTKLKLENVTFHQDGNKLDRVQINDIVDLRKAKEISLQYIKNPTKYVLDLSGCTTLDSLDLGRVEILNGEPSQWIIDQFSTTRIPYSLNSGMKIKELSLHNPGPIDLVTLPDSIHKLALFVTGNEITVSCSQPVVLENLQYLNIWKVYEGTDLSHFRSCPRLTHLKFTNCYLEEQEFSWIPKNLKSLILENSKVLWNDDISLNLEKLILRYCRYLTDLVRKERDFLKKLLGFQTKILVEDLVLYDTRMTADIHLVDVLECRNRFNYGKRLYIGELDWKEKQLENSLLKEYVDVKSSFYVFESGQKGRAISEKTFYELIPKHWDSPL